MHKMLIETKGTSGRVYKSTQLLFMDELADALRKSRSYIKAMKRAGFVMPGGTATLEEARGWLATQKNFSCTGYINSAQKSSPTVKIIDVRFE